MTDAQGISLYLFEADKGKQGSSCYNECAKAWPPLKAAGKPGAGSKIEASQLGTTKRKDGSMQVTYSGWPLYHYTKDKTPGDTKGQDIKEFGAEWYLVSPKGEKVEAKGKS